MSQIIGFLHFHYFVVLPTLCLGQCWQTEYSKSGTEYSKSDNMLVLMLSYWSHCCFWFTLWITHSGESSTNGTRALSHPMEPEIISKVCFILPTRNYIIQQSTLTFERCETSWKTIPGPIEPSENCNLRSHLDINIMTDPKPPYQATLEFLTMLCEISEW